MQDLLIKNLGAIVSGDITRGILSQADAVAVSKGKITAIGQTAQMDESLFHTVVDAAGQTLVPGFIDAHVHNGAEDYSACTRSIGMFEEALYHGTTSMISEGEQGPGYPRFYEDAEGNKAQSIFINHVYRRFRPGGGLKLHAGALVLTPGLEEEDFIQLREAGIWTIAEIGGGGLGDFKEIQRQVGLAKKHGFFVSVHLAPPSIPGSTWLRARDIIELQPDKVAHANGGTTSSSWDEIRAVIEETHAGIELLPGGNEPKFLRTLEYLGQRNQSSRVVFGSDAPTGACSLIGAMNRAVLKAAALGGVPVQQAISMATGNTACLYGLNTGQIEQGREADLVIIDAPPGCEGEDALSAIRVGDMFGCSLVVSDGRIIVARGRDTRATNRVCRINGMPFTANGIHEFLYQPPVFFRQ